jgi:hypothetical protein
MPSSTTLKRFYSDAARSHIELLGTDSAKAMFARRGEDPLGAIPDHAVLVHRKPRLGN